MPLTTLGNIHHAYWYHREHERRLATYVHKAARELADSIDRKVCEMMMSTFPSPTLTTSEPLTYEKLRAVINATRSPFNV